MTGLGAGVAAALALCLAFIDVHRAARGPWWASSVWSWLVMSSDAAMAAVWALIGGSLAAQFSDLPSVLVVVAIAVGFTGARVLRLLPLPGGLPPSQVVLGSVEARSRCAREYMLERVQAKALATSNRWLMSRVFPAALTLGPAGLGDIVLLSIDELIRRRACAEDVHDLVLSIEQDDCSDEMKVKSLLRVLLDHAGEPICREIVRRSERGEVVSIWRQERRLGEMGS